MGIECLRTAVAAVAASVDLSASFDGVDMVLFGRTPLVVMSLKFLSFRAQFAN